MRKVGLADIQEDFFLMKSLGGNVCCMVLHVFDVERGFLDVAVALASAYRRHGDGVPGIHLFDAAFAYRDVTLIGR